MPVLQYAEEFDSSGSLQDQYFDAYVDLGVHRVLLADMPRMQFYQQALTRDDVVRGGVVVDVGSGTGVLSMWAARAGAKHVFSIEASSLSHVQRLAVANNNLADRVTVLSDTVENIVARGAAAFVEQNAAVLESRGVSVVVSEWMGFYLLHEGMLLSVLSARDFFCEVNRLLGVSRQLVMIPEHAAIRVAPISSAPYYAQRYHDFWGDVGGVDLSLYGKMEFQARLECCGPLIDTVPPSCLLHEGAALAALELTSIDAEAVKSLRRTVHFDFSTSPAFQRHLNAAQPHGAVVIDGLTLWFDVSFRGLVLSTSPELEPTHWKQTTVLLPTAAREEKLVSFTSAGEGLDVEVRLDATDDLARCYKIEFELK